MPEDPVIWIVAILAGAVVLVLALVLGGAVEAGINPLRLRFRRKPVEGRERVELLREAEIRRARLGDVTGAEDGRASTADRQVEVARKARITDAQLGDITGVRAVPAKRQEND